MRRRDDRDPFALLGLPPTATAEDVRAARRLLAAGAHPDVGGEIAAMQQINAAADSALAIIDRRTASRRPPSNPSWGHGSPTSEPTSGGHRSGPAGSATFDDAPSFSFHDVPSFVIDVLPVEAFEWLLLAAAELGEVVEDDPPYHLVVLAHDPGPYWLVLTVVPDAGASTISLHIGEVDAEQVAARDRGPAMAEMPTIERVRDRWIEVLNALEW